MWPSVPHSEHRTKFCDQFRPSHPSFLRLPCDGAGRTSSASILLSKSAMPSCWFLWSSFMVSRSLGARGPLSKQNPFDRRAGCGLNSLRLGGLLSHWTRHRSFPRNLPKFLFQGLECHLSWFHGCQARSHFIMQSLHKLLSQLCAPITQWQECLNLTSPQLYTESLSVR